MSTENKNKVATLDQRLAAAASVKDLLQLDVVRDRFIKNYEAVSGRKDGANRLEQEKFAYLELLAEKPDLKKVDNFYHYAAIVKAGTTGLSFRDNKLYVIPKGAGLVVKPSPAGKREMMEMMATVKSVPEAVLVMKGDHFVHDKRKNQVKEHYTTKDTIEKIALENIRASYQTIEWKDGTFTDVVVYYDELLKAKAKSPAQSEASFWAQWPGEACKKVSTNRAFRLYHKYPDNIVIYGDDNDDAETETKDVDYSEDANYSEETRTQAGEPVDRETGEVTEAQVVPEEKKTRVKRPIQGELL